MAKRDSHEEYLELIRGAGITRDSLHKFGAMKEVKVETFGTREPKITASLSGGLQAEFDCGDMKRMGGGEVFIGVPPMAGSGLSGFDFSMEPRFKLDVPMAKVSTITGRLITGPGMKETETKMEPQEGIDYLEEADDPLDYESREDSADDDEVELDDEQDGPESLFEVEFDDLDFDGDFDDMKKLLEGDAETKNWIKKLRRAYGRNRLATILGFVRRYVQHGEVSQLQFQMYSREVNHELAIKCRNLEAKLHETQERVKKLQHLEQRNSELEKYNKRNQQIVSEATGTFFRLQNMVTPDSQPDDPAVVELKARQERFKEYEFQIERRHREAFKLLMERKIELADLELMCPELIGQSLSEWFGTRLQRWQNWESNLTQTICSYHHLRSRSELTAELARRYFEETSTGKREDVHPGINFHAYGSKHQQHGGKVEIGL